MGKAIREIFGETLAELGAEYPDIVALDADLSGSTKSAVFGKKYPERFSNMGIAEADMVATAAGLATVGKIPFVNTFTVFLTSIGLIATRAQVCYANLNVKLAGAYGGMSDALDGASHHATEDLAIMRALPNMRVIVPSDPASTRWATRWAVENDGPVYLRLSRMEFPELYGADESFELGKAKVVREGKDCTVFAIGIMVHKALEAAELLAAEGIDVQVVDLLSLKPIDAETVIRCAKQTGCCVVAEEHQPYGGACSAVSEVLAKAGIGARTEFVAVPDCFTQSGKYDLLMERYGLDAASVAAAVRKVKA